jgi:hypothetical protein
VEAVINFVYYLLYDEMQRYYKKFKMEFVPTIFSSNSNGQDHSNGLMWQLQLHQSSQLPHLGCPLTEAEKKFHL